MEVLIQVNVAGEKQKGVPSKTEGPLIEVILRSTPTYESGLMCMARFRRIPKMLVPCLNRPAKFETIRQQGTGGHL